MNNGAKTMNLTREEAQEVEEYYDAKYCKLSDETRAAIPTNYLCQRAAMELEKRNFASFREFIRATSASEPR